MKKIQENVINRRGWYVAGVALFYLASSLVLRAVLLGLFGKEAFHQPASAAHIFINGLRADTAIGLLLFAPLALWLQLLPEKIFASRTHQILLKAALTIYFIGQLFMFVVEWGFFDEFNARFNTVAVDYLLYPQEVFVNIWESYPVLKILLGTILGGVLVATVLNWGYQRLSLRAVSLKSRWGWLAGYLFLIGVAAGTKSFDPKPFSQNRVYNEVTRNGTAAFVNAAVTRNLDYPAFYATLEKEEAYARTRALLTQNGVTFTSDTASIERLVPGQFKNPPKNLVILLIESFGSEFWGSLGRKEPTLTPEMDALSKEGLLFTNLYACGNRTVRGMEGVLASFPPLPGDSIVKRNMSDNVSTIARTLKSQGFQTLFMYGGRGVFDGMRSFTMRNGYDRFIEQKDFPKPTFTTIWGVCDEDLYRRGIDELRALHATKKPFFVTFLSVSNHKPYSYPAGRIPEDPNARSRAHAVKYTDWSLGEFFRLAKKEEFYKDTVFAVVADHGARVYGSQKIPIPSYRIPLLIVGAGVKKPALVDTLGGSLDVGPTLMGMLGANYNSVFFGQDIFRKGPGNTWAVMNHNRDVGLFRNNRLVVLGINKTVDYYSLSNDRRDLTRLETVGPEEEQLKKDAIALFQVADDLYTGQRYHLQ